MLRFNKRKTNASQSRIGLSLVSYFVFLNFIIVKFSYAKIEQNEELK